MSVNHIEKRQRDSYNFHIKRLQHENIIKKSEGSVGKIKKSHLLFNDRRKTTI